MSRSRIHIRRMTLGAFAVVAAACALVLGASSAAADNPRDRPCQAKIDAAVHAALPTATSVTCPVYEPEYRIVNGQSVPLPSDGAKAEAALPDGRVAVVDVSDDGVVKSIGYRHSDLSGSSGKGMALLFWVFALVSVAGALFVISRRNLIAAVMGMVGSFLGIAAIYMMLYAQFLAVIQMLVYAGAIMVLFVFVVMILNRPEDEPVAPSGRAGQALGGLGILYLVGRLILTLTRVEPPNPEVAMNAPQPLPAQCVAWHVDESVAVAPGRARPLACTETARADWGSIQAVGVDLFGPGLFPFEAISVLLLVAVVGAIAIARPLRDGDDSQRSEGGAA